MNETLRTLLNIDAYTDSLTRRRALNLYLVAVILTLINLFVLYDKISGEEVVSDEYVLVGIFGIALLGMFWLNRTGQQRTAAWLLVGVGIVIAIFPAILLEEEVEISLSQGYALWLALVLSGLVVVRRDVLAFTIFALGALLLAFALGAETPDSVHLGKSSAQLSFFAFTTAIGVVAWIISRSTEMTVSAEQVQETRRRLILTQTSAAVAQRIFTRLDLDTLLNETVELIRTQFEDIYHAQVFLIDTDTHMAVLRASTGEVGRALIAKKHALGVGSTSVIGRVTEVGIPVLASDASTDVVHKANELLPDTLTELAIPLRSQEGIIGALDVQSTKRNAFSSEDIEILQLLADQIAIAVENARLFAAAQDEAERAKALAEASQITSRLSTNFERGLASLFEAITAPGGYTHWWFGLVESDQRHIRRVTSHRSVMTMFLVPSIIDTLNDQNSLAYVYNKKAEIIVNDLSASPGFGGGGSPELREMFGKHIAAPIFGSDGETVVGVLLVGREQSDDDMEQRDYELVTTVTSQISIALQNRQLLNRLEAEQKTLQSVLDNMPVSVVVVDVHNKILLVNSQAQSILGDNIQVGADFEILHTIYRTGTEELYPTEELPLRVALDTGTFESAEDLAIRMSTGAQVDVVSRAAPILDENGKVTAVVTVYQDITELRELERALQESLSETTKLYEASRSVSHANTVNGIARAVTMQLQMLGPDRIYMTLATDDEAEPIQVVHSWPQTAPKQVAEIGLPRSVLMPSTHMGTTNLTFATRNLHLLPGVEEPDLTKMAQTNVNALAVLPLEARGQVFGAVIATFSAERHFAPEERRFLLTLADQTSVAMDAVRSFENTQKALRSISNLYQASRAIAEVQDVAEAMNVIFEQIQILAPDRINISLTRDQDALGSLESVLDWSPEGQTPENILRDAHGETYFDMLSREEYFIEDTMSSEFPIAKEMSQDGITYKAVASIPFRAAGQPTGRLTLGYRDPHIFSEDEQQFLRMIADSAAYIIENDMLFKQTQDSLEETGILYQAIRAFANATDTEGILQAIIDYAADPAVDKALLALLLTPDWHSTNALMEVVVSWVRGDSVDLTGMRFTAEQFPSWEQISTTEILWVDDVMKDETLDDTARMGYRALDIASFVIVPLIMANKPIGAILLGSSEPRRHNEREVRIYQSLADQAAITMENLRLYDEAERRARQLQTAARVGQAASSILQIEELLPEMVDLIKESFGYDQVQVFLLSDDNKNALLKASTGESGRQLLAIGHFLPVGSHSVIGTVTSTGKPSIALDTADARVIHKPNPYLPNTRSEMAIPLIAKGKVLGALDVQSNQPGAFTEADERVLAILADQMAVAIENASLFELSQLHSEEMGFLFTVAAESTTSAELDEMLLNVGELLLHQLEAGLVLPYLFNETTQTLELGAVSSTPELENVHIPAVVALDTDDPVAAVANNKMPIVITNTGQNGHYHVRTPVTKSGIYVPLITGNTFVGVLGLESLEPNKFTDDSLNLLQALTGSLSAVIQSSSLLRAIQAANERLLEIDKLKTNFLAAMSHELRTPLNSIIGFSRVILKGIDGPITEMQQQDLQTIHDSGKHLLGLVNDILDQAKIEANKMELSKEYFDLSEVVKGVMSSAVGLTKEKPIRLYTEVAPDIPMAYGDEFRTRQILFNLVSNAAKFTENGSITTSVHLVNQGGVDYIQVSVTDTGIGIREQDFGKLFESFQQVDNSTTRAAEGTGLGLPLARSLAELQGGTVWVESEYGVGSTFSVTIPIEPLEEPEESEAASTQSKPILQNFIPKTILVVEDNVEMINFYRRHLSNQGYDIIGVTNAQDATQKLMTVRPSAVIVNVNMHEDHGWDYLGEILNVELPHPVPVIVSSLQPDATRSEEMGAALHLTRPFTPDDLLSAIQELENKVSS